MINRLAQLFFTVLISVLSTACILHCLLNFWHQFLFFIAQFFKGGCSVWDQGLKCHLSASIVNCIHLEFKPPLLLSCNFLLLPSSFNLLGFDFHCNHLELSFSFLFILIHSLDSLLSNCRFISVHFHCDIFVKNWIFYCHFLTLQKIWL